MGRVNDWWYRYWNETYPERARQEGNHTAPESWFLALGCNTFVDTFSQPDVGLHVPRVEKDFEVGREFDLRDFHVGGTFPLRCT